MALNKSHASIMDAITHPWQSNSSSCTKWVMLIVGLAQKGGMYAWQFWIDYLQHESALAPWLHRLDDLKDASWGSQTGLCQQHTPRHLACP